MSQDVQKTLFAFPASKKKIASRLIELIPKHKVYVEPFAGGAAVFFAKELAAVNVLADANPEIVTAYRAIKSITNAELEHLEKKDWLAAKATFDVLLKSTPTDKIDSLYRFLYVSRYSYGRFRKSFDPIDGVRGTRTKAVERIKRFRDRLKNTKIIQGDYAKVIERFDSSDAFFFLDPPYHGLNANVGERKFDEERFRKVLDGIKGKFLVTYIPKSKLNTKGFHVKKLNVTRVIATSVGGEQINAQIIVTNYIATKKQEIDILDPFEEAWVEGDEITKTTSTDPRKFDLLKIAVGNEPAKLTNERSKLRDAREDNEGERCGLCRFFSEPSACSIVDGPVTKDLVCDWIQSREVEGAKKYEVSEEDWLAFGAGMIETQPYQHIVRDVANTPEGQMVLIQDTSEQPHFFSLSREFHIDHTTLEHHWTQVEVDDLIAVGRRILEKNDLKKQDPLSDLPKKSGPQPAIFQYHFRGKSLHGDLRFKVNNHLVGWTLSLQRPGAVKEAVDTVEQARRLARTYGVEGDRIAKPILAPAKILATPKDRHPVVWLGIDGKVFEEGEEGASENERGVIVAVDKPSVEFGLQKPSSHEYFFTKGKQLNGIMFFRLLTGRAGGTADEPFWTAFLSKEFLPSVLNRRAVETKSMPPDGLSAIPISLERTIPREFQYWKAKDAEARKIRDALVESKFLTEKNIKMVNGEFRRIVQKFYLSGSEAKVEKIRTTFDKLASASPKPSRYVELFTETGQAKETLPVNADNYFLLDGDITPRETFEKYDDPDVLFYAPLAHAPGLILDDFIGELSKIRGHYVVTCPDSLSARIALSKIGRVFKFEDDSNLHLTSFAVRDRDDIEWIDEKQAEVIDFTPEPAQSGAVKKLIAKALTDRMRLIKTGEEHYVLGVVLEPNDGKDGADLDPDTQHDIYSQHDIRKAAHRFLPEFSNIGLMHKQIINHDVDIVESYLAPVDFVMDGERVRKGAWLLAVIVKNAALWKKIKSGEITGYSIGGSALRSPARVGALKAADIFELIGAE